MSERKPPDYVAPIYRPPTEEEFRHLLSVWELTGSAAGEQAGVKGRQIRRYTSGDQSVPYAVLFTLCTKNEAIQITQNGWRWELSSALNARGVIPALEPTGTG